MGKVVKLESKQPSAARFCTRLHSKSARARVREDSPLTPELKAFIDRVAVPILVQTYLSELQSEKQIAENAEGAASCELMTDTLEAEVSR